MAFPLPADTNGSNGLPTQQQCRAQARRRPWPGWGGAAVRYHPSNRPRTAASIRARGVTGMTVTDRSCWARNTRCPCPIRARSVPDRAGSHGQPRVQRRAPWAPLAPIPAGQLADGGAKPGDSQAQVSLTLSEGGREASGQVKVERGARGCGGPALTESKLDRSGNVSRPYRFGFPLEPVARVGLIRGDYEGSPGVTRMLHGVGARRPAQSLAVSGPASQAPTVDRAADDNAP